MPHDDTLRFSLHAFADLGGDALYDVLALRAQIFVVEQHCAYLDPDGLDRGALHLLARRGDALVAYLRILPPGARFTERAIGRVVVARAERGTGLGRRLMAEALTHVGSEPVRLAAQAHLEAFYGSLGFVREGDVFDEDGIPHVEMLRGNARPGAP